MRKGVEVTFADVSKNNDIHPQVKQRIEDGPQHAQVAPAMAHLDRAHGELPPEVELLAWNKEQTGRWFQRFLQ